MRFIQIRHEAVGLVLHRRVPRDAHEEGVDRSTPESEAR
jgi:hypothetical protein